MGVFCLKSCLLKKKKTQKDLRDVCYKLAKATRLKRKGLGTSRCPVGLKMGNFQAERATRHTEERNAHRATLPTQCHHRAWLRAVLWGGEPRQGDDSRGQLLPGEELNSRIQLSVKALLLSVSADSGSPHVAGGAEESPRRIALCPHHFLQKYRSLHGTHGVIASKKLKG